MNVHTDTIDIPLLNNIIYKYIYIYMYIYTYIYILIYIYML